jgi:hypothetical protein
MGRRIEVCCDFVLWSLGLSDRQTNQQAEDKSCHAHHCSSTQAGGFRLEIGYPHHPKIYT